ncbi:MAG TPA: shikimate dehydrogenase [Gemmatimonadaceae bacterium]|nr:shikimate dehydrogenase [Gemmatimonadaceae bacterium]
MTAAGSAVALPGRLVLLGHPVAHSLSPAFQNAALRRARLPLVYEALDVPSAALPAMLGELARVHAAGNVTIPHKEAVAARCVRLTPLARRVGAVNTFWHEGPDLVGENTDVGGVDEAVRALLGGPPEGARVALIGAGGSAAAVLAAAEGWGGARVAIWSRSHERSVALAARFPAVAESPEFLAEAIRGADLVVNATPIGLSGDEIPFPPALLRRSAALLDLVYRRDGPTPWVRLGRAQGRRASDGLPMLIAQGALAFECWFGVSADRAAMWEAIAHVPGGGAPAGSDADG